MNYCRVFDQDKGRLGRKLTTGLIGLLLMVLLSSAAIAQETADNTNAPAATVTPAASPTPIPFSDVITQAENADSTLKEIAAGAAADPATSAIERDLPALTDEINSRLEETAQTVEGSTSLDNLRSFEADWRTLTRSMPGWRSDLTRRARDLGSDLERLDALIAKWQKTLDELSAGQTPPEVLLRIGEIIRIGLETRQAITAEQARVVGLQNRLAEQQNRVNEALNTIGTRRDALVDQLLVRDSPAIWSPSLWTRSEVVRGLSESLNTQLDGLYAFAERNREKLIIHFLIFAALAGAMFFLRRRVRPLVEANEDLKRPAAIFYSPASTALVLAIFFSSRIYPQTPQILGAIFGAILLVPTVIILRKLVGRKLFPLLYAFVAFFLIDQIRAISDAVPAVSRPIFMAEMLAATVLFLWFYRTGMNRPDEPDAPPRGKVFQVVHIAAVVVVPFFAVALLANMFGYVNLSHLIGGAVLRSAYSALVLYAAVLIIEGLIVFALRMRPLNWLKMARDSSAEIQQKTSKILRWVALVLWIIVTLELFTLRELVFAQLRWILTAELALGSISISAGDVLLFLIVVWAAFMLSRFIRFALEEDVYPRFPLANGIPYAVSTIVNYLILLGGFLIAVGAAGVDLTRVTVLVGAFGVGIGFGLQNIFNNFISGLILLFERPVKVGDEIEIGQESGIVKRIGIRASRLRQWDQSEIIVPNSKLISESVKNWSFYARRRGIEIPISVAHGTDTDLVTSILLDAAKEHPLVLEKPGPQILASEITSPALTFKLRAWTAKTDQVTPIASEIAMSISRKLAANDIVVPHVTTGTI